jgi:dihydroflavonol-4-reductase
VSPSPGLTLITGATGFIGGRLLERLHAAGEPLRALVRSEAAAVELRRQGIETIRGDLTDPESLRPALQGVQTVYHLASVLGPANVPAARYQAVNVEGTRSLLRLAREADVLRVVHVSSVAVLGAVGRQPVDESAPHNPGDVYERTKSEAERLALAAAEEGLHVVVARPAWVYGPGDRRTLKLIRMIARRRLIIVGSGQALQHPVHVDDVVRGLQACARRGPRGEVFHLAGPEIVTVQQLCETIARACEVPLPRVHLPLAPVLLAARILGRAGRLLGRELPIDERKVDFFRKNRAYSIEKARRILEFQPRITLEPGMEETVRWYRARGWL